jgi:hypothetical protein
MTPRKPGTFRFDTATTDRWTRVLLVVLGVTVGVGIGLGIASDSAGAPDWLATAATVVVIAGVAVPLLVAAVLGGEAITRGGGLVGALLVAGMAVAGWGFWDDSTPWKVAGFALAGAAVVGFWVMGWRAGVPMYVGLPWSHGRVVQNRPPDALDPDALRVRPAPRRAARATPDPRR